MQWEDLSVKDKLELDRAVIDYSTPEPPKQAPKPQKTTASDGRRPLAAEEEYVPIKDEGVPKTDMPAYWWLK